MSVPEPQRVTIDELLEFMGDRALGRSKFTSPLVNRLAPLSPGKSGALSFAQGSSPQRLAAVLSCRSSVILVEDTTLDEVGESATAVLVAVVDPRLEFARVASHFFTQDPSRDMAPSAVIAESAVVGRDSTIGPGAYVAPGVVIGEGCRLGANSVLLEGTVLGDHTSVGPNSTIGNTGFGYARDEYGAPVLVPHYGGVRIGSHVDIGANTCIDRGALEDTVVEDHVKIDNLVHIAQLQDP